MNNAILSYSSTNRLNLKKYRSTNKSEQLDKDLYLILEKLRKCCDTCNATWKEWDKCIKDITYSIHKKPYECINALTKNLIKMQNLPIRFSTVDNESIAESERKRRNHIDSKIQMINLNSQKEMEFLKLHTCIHRNYDPKNNGLYPFIKTNGSEYKIKKIDSHSFSGKDNRIYSYKKIKPYISSKKTPEERLALYDAQLVVKRLGHDNNKLLLKEATLSGQNGVFAKKNIPTDTCIGIHGGTILFVSESGLESNHLPKNILLKINQDYLVILNENVFLDANNIISKINSNFYKQSNRQWFESDNGYNVDSIKFGCEMEDGNKLYLYAIFTTQDIKKDEEIRMSYQYPADIVNQAMQTNELVTNVNAASLLKSIKKYVNFEKVP